MREKSMKSTGAFCLWLAILFTILFIVGCATQAKYEAILNTWIGSNINNMMNSWGYPSGSFKSPNGNTVYVYGDSRTMTMPTQSRTTQDFLGNYETTITGGETINLHCTTYIETDEHGMIVKWSFKGNHCVSQ
jgi:hypothetical protein